VTVNGIGPYQLRQADCRVGYEQPRLAEPQVCHLGTAYLESYRRLSHGMDELESYGKVFVFLKSSKMLTLNVLG